MSAHVSRAMPWFCFHVDFLSNPKMWALTKAAQRDFVALLCLKSSGQLDQAFPSTQEREALVAWQLRLSKASAKKRKAQFMALALIDENWQPTGWESRQLKARFSQEQATSSPAAQRKQQQRQRLKSTTNTTEQPLNGAQEVVESKQVCDISRDVSHNMSRDASKNVPFLNEKPIVYL